MISDETAIKNGILASVYNFDQYLKTYLDHYTGFSLEGIGQFMLPEDYRPPFNPSFISFRYNRYEVTNRELIEFISEKTGKSVSVIKGAIDAYLSMIRQMVNIGNPYTLQGIGTIKLANTGEYIFVPLDPSTPKKQRSSSVGMMSAEKSSKNTNKIILFAIAISIVIGIAGVIGWGGYHFVTQNILNRSADTATAHPLNEIPLSPAAIVADSGSVDTGLAITSTPKAVPDSVERTFMFVYETTSSPARAEKRTAQLQGYGNPAAYDSVTENGKSVYRLFLKIQSAARDTASKRDSIKKFLQKEIIVLPLQ